MRIRFLRNSGLFPRYFSTMLLLNLFFKVRILSSWDFSLTGHQYMFGVDDAADISCLANKRYHSDVVEKNQNGGWLLNGEIWQRKQRQRRLIK